MLQSPLEAWLLRCHATSRPKHQQASRRGEWRCRWRDVRVATAFGEESSAAAKRQHERVGVVATTRRDRRCGSWPPGCVAGEQMFQRQFLGDSDSDTDAILPDESVHYGRVCSGRLGYGEHRSTRIQAPRA